jgi:hypothetical protein
VREKQGRVEKKRREVERRNMTWEEEVIGVQGEEQESSGRRKRILRE